MSLQNPDVEIGATGWPAIIIIAVLIISAFENIIRVILKIWSLL